MKIHDCRPSVEFAGYNGYSNNNLEYFNDYYNHPLRRLPLTSRKSLDPRHLGKRMHKAMFNDDNKIYIKQSKNVSFDRNYRL